MDCSVCIQPQTLQQGRILLINLVGILGTVKLMILLQGDQTRFGVIQNSGKLFSVFLFLRFSVYLRFLRFMRFPFFLWVFRYFTQNLLGHPVEKYNCEPKCNWSFLSKSR